MDVNDIDPMSNAPDVRHVLEFDFLAKSYTKFFLEEENADYSEEEEQLRDRYSALRSKSTRKYEHDFLSRGPF